MRCYLFLIFLIFSDGASAQVPLILGPNGRQEEYANFLKQNSNFVSWSKFQQDKFTSNEVQENQLFEVVNFFDQDPSSALRFIATQRKKSPLSFLSLQFIYDLTRQKLLNKYSDEIEMELRQLHCETGQLIAEAEVKLACPKQYPPPLNSSLFLSNRETILVESLPFDQIVQNISIDSRYQWTILRNDQNPLSFMGSYSEFVLFHKTVEDQAPLVSGTCDNFFLKEHLDNSFSIFFLPDCIRDKNWRPSEGLRRFWKNPWVLSAGILVSVTALIYLSDKTLKVSIPF
jgi:hypothetical protein